MKKEKNESEKVFKVKPIVGEGEGEVEMRVQWGESKGVVAQEYLECELGDFVKMIKERDLDGKEEEWGEEKVYLKADRFMEIARAKTGKVNSYSAVSFVVGIMVLGLMMGMFYLAQWEALRGHEGEVWVGGVLVAMVVAALWRRFILVRNKAIDWLEDFLEM